MKDPKFARFYLLSKINKRLDNVLGRPVITNSGHYAENISSFLDYDLQPVAQAVKSYIKDQGHQRIPKKAPLCTKVPWSHYSMYYGCCGIICKHTA